MSNLWDCVLALGRLASNPSPTDVERLEAIELARRVAVGESARLAGLARRRIDDATRDAERALVATRLAVYRQSHPGASRTSARPYIVKMARLPEWRVRVYLKEIGRPVTNRPDSEES